MDLFSRTSNSEFIEKQYPYRYSWPSTILILLVGGAGTLGFILMAISEKKAIDWFFVLFFGTLFLFAAWILAVNIFGKLTLKITQTGIYIPSIWKWEEAVYIPFSAISAIDMIEAQGNIFLQLSVGKKKYPIVHSWFAHKEDFQELTEIVHKRAPIFIPTDSM